MFVLYLQDKVAHAAEERYVEIVTLVLKLLRDVRITSANFVSILGFLELFFLEL